MFITKCEYCKKDFSTKEKKQRFCSRSCAGVVHNRIHRQRSQEEINKMRESLKSFYKEHPDAKQKRNDSIRDFYKNHPEKIQRGSKQSMAVGASTKGKFNENPESLMELSKRTVSKILLRLHAVCSRCGWGEGVGDIHHIHGRKIPDADNHGNLCYLCPNCHRIVKKIPIEELIPLTAYIGDKWKQFYYG